MEKRDLIKRFQLEGLTLRPECLPHLTAYLLQQKVSNTGSSKAALGKILDEELGQILQNVRVLAARNGSIILEESVVKGAIELLQRSRQQMVMEEEGEEEEEVGGGVEVMHEDSRKKKELFQIIDEKYKTSIVVLDTMKESMRVALVNGKLLATNDKRGERSITLGAPNDKVTVFRSRFAIVKGKMMENSQRYLFGDVVKETDKTSGIAQKQPVREGQLRIDDVGSTVGSKGVEKCVLGMICEGLAGEYFIQDELSRARIDVSQALVQSGYINVSSVVIAIGTYDAMYGVMRVKELILPEYTEAAWNSGIKRNDSFGAKWKVEKVLGRLVEIELMNSSSNSRKGRQISNGVSTQVELGIFDLHLNPTVELSRAEELCVVVFSDFLISDATTISRFEGILTAFQGNLKPLMFVLMGQFFEDTEITSVAVHESMKRSLNDFVTVLDKFKGIRDHCYFLLIPHVNDVGGAPVQPKIELPEELFEEVIAAVPYLKLVKNPCRVSVLGKSFLFQRSDLLRDLRKRQIALNSDKDIQMNYVKTVLSQRHLSPLQMIQKPTIWNYDHTMMFSETPDFLILADAYSEQFDFALQIRKKNEEDEAGKVETHYVLNPGDFHKKSTFTLIYPLTGEVQSSAM